MHERRTTAARILTIIALIVSVGASARAQQSGAVQRPQTIIQEVRAAIASDNWSVADERLAAYRAKSGITPEWLEAHSWMARGHLAAKHLDSAERYANDTYKLASDMLKTRPMDREPRLPIAYGAALEVLAQVGAERGARTDSILMLERELKTHSKTSIAKRLQKNINLLSLEGTKAPSIVTTDYLGSAPPPTLDALKGKVVVLFFWAHWCPDCKRMAPILGELDKQYRERGLTIFAPTQRYGYVAGGRDASPAEEKQYIDQVRRDTYPVLDSYSIPLDEANHLRYGVSTTPTVVLVDHTGIIRLYHPGQMTLEELRPRIEALLRGSAAS